MTKDRDGIERTNAPVEGGPVPSRIRAASSDADNDAAGGRGGSLAAFLRSRRGGGMLAGAVLGTVALLVAGGATVDHAWREAQKEELRAALRAAVSASGAILSGAGDDDINALIAKRVADFAEATMPGLDVDEDDVTVAYDPDTRIATVSFGDATYRFTELFGTGSDVDVGDHLNDNTLRVQLNAYRYEVAVALDLSRSMAEKITGPNNTRIVKLDALKKAMEDVADVIQSVEDDTIGSMMVSMIPFTGAVNVADTAGDGETDAKKRYLRMLAGAPAKNETLDDTLAAARATVADGWSHWVDSFHHYGVGADLGALRKRTLPKGVLDGTDWNLRRKSQSVDVSAQVPTLDTGGGAGKWVVDDEDFWNGCVMARWGAYWHPDARPDGWSPPGVPNDWPYRKAVPAWSPRGLSLKATATPVHLSDAPPDADDYNTLFTAYSWPDARIGGTADHRLQTAMATLLEAPTRPQGLLNSATWADNDWSAADSRGGATLCPQTPILPLTDDFKAFRKAVENLETGCVFPDCEAQQYQTGMTYVFLGVVWGLRTLSPLWQRVWNVEDLQGNPHPVVTCAENDSVEHCDPNTTKSILIVSDGLSLNGRAINARLRNDRIWDDWDHNFSQCRGWINPKYHDAAAQTTSQAFNAKFARYLDGGTFGGGRLGDVVDAFGAFDRFDNVTPAQRDKRRAVIETLTPWQLFRGLDASVTDALMDEANSFGFDQRPVQMGHFCRPTTAFGPYGRLDDAVYVGENSTPAHNAAPFRIPAGVQRSDFTLDRPFYSTGPLQRSMLSQLEDWLLEACTIAGKRGVDIHAIYIGPANHAAAIKHLETCVDAAGGDPGEDEVYVTPDSDGLKNAFKELFRIRRSLRFLD